MLSLLNSIMLPELTDREKMLKSAARCPDPAVGSDDDNYAQINEGIVLSFDKTLSSQQRDDVSHSLLFAQLAADKKFNRHSATQDWQESFTGVLATVGWNMLHFASQSIELSAPVDWAALVNQHIPDATQSLAGASIHAAQDLTLTSPAFTLWESAAINPHKYSDGLFIVTPTLNVQNSPQIIVLMLAYHFTSDVEGFMKWQEGYSIDIYKLGLKLNEDIYNQLRQPILTKLGDRPEYLIANIPLDTAM
ncbi:MULTISPECIES: hypothetical protein [unclassified Kosakonia]|uniref:hypothetical protein n=1 Tax=unclassified Kosakonia TaxID=2632876 RepID=UPI0031B6CF8B